MKKHFIILSIVLQTVCSKAQVLFTENFDSYPVGNISNDITGTQPGLGGWYINAHEMNNFNPHSTPADYQIVTEAGRGNVYYTTPFLNETTWLRRLFRNDIKTYWQQRTPGNNVLKISFDVFTGNGDRIGIYSQLFSDEGGLVGFTNHLEYGVVTCNNGRRGKNLDFVGAGPYIKINGSHQNILPPNTWVTLEMYVDYNTSKVYHSVPMLNYTIQQNLPYTLQQNTEFDDSPSRFEIRIANMLGNPHAQGVKYDNISISAQNTVPVVTAGLDEVLANQFNIYPNPASRLVAITNAENLPVQQIIIYDMAGKQLSTQTFNTEANVQLNIENLANGTYMLHIQTTEGTAVKQLVKK